MIQVESRSLRKRPKVLRGLESGNHALNVETNFGAKFKISKSCNLIGRKNFQNTRDHPPAWELIFCSIIDILIKVQEQGQERTWIHELEHLEKSNKDVKDEVFVGHIPVRPCQTISYLIKV